NNAAASTKVSGEDEATARQSLLGNGVSQRDSAVVQPADLVKAVHQSLGDSSPFPLEPVDDVSEAEMFQSGSQLTKRSLSGIPPPGHTEEERSFSLLRVEFTVSRDRGFYLINMYFPTLLCVVISWFAFYIRLDNAPARVILDLGMLLNLLSVNTGVRSELPPVSYIKALDVWMGACVCAVFASLLVFILVNYMGRIKQRPKFYRQVDDTAFVLLTKRKDLAEDPGSYDNEEYDELYRNVKRAQGIDRVARTLDPVSRSNHGTLRIIFSGLCPWCRHHPEALDPHHLDGRSVSCLSLSSTALGSGSHLGRLGSNPPTTWCQKWDPLFPRFDMAAKDAPKTSGTAAVSINGWLRPQQLRSRPAGIPKSATKSAADSISPRACATDSISPRASTS
ncbi:hypothetical protein HPB47_016646, partial [Ixodes persulcatus]